MRGLIFLTLRNNCPRLKIFDKIKVHFIQISRNEDKRRCTIFGPLIIRPVGKASNIEIGEETFLNAEIRFGWPDNKIKIDNNCQIGPHGMF